MFWIYITTLFIVSFLWSLISLRGQLKKEKRSRKGKLSTRETILFDSRK